MEVSPLEKLEKRVQTEPEKVTTADVNTACAEDEKMMNKLYDDLGEKPDSALRKAHKERVEAFRQLMLSHINDLRQPYSAGRLNYFKEAQELRSEVSKQVGAMKKRLEMREQAKKFARENTSKTIGDFEGWDTKNNTVRLALEGYIRGSGVDDKAGAEAVLKQAKELELASDEGWTNGQYKNWDEQFKAEHLMENMGLKAYTPDLAKYEFSSETIGYLSAFLKKAEALSATDRETYRRYFFGKLDELKAGGKLDFKGSKDDNLAKGDFELNVLNNELMSPKEFLEGMKGIRDLFKKLKDTANKLSSALGFAYADGKVRDLLTKNPDQITKEDEKSIIDAAAIIRQEAYTNFLAATTAANTSIQEAGTRVDQLKADNAKKKKLEVKEIDALKKVLDDATADLKKITLGPTDSLDQLATQVDYLQAARNKVMSVESRVAEMRKKLEEADKKPDGSGGAAGSAGGEKIDTYKDNWENASEVDYVWKAKYLRVSPNVSDAVYRDNKGNVLGKIPGLTELTVVDVNAKCKKVNDNIFIKVYYKEGGGRGPSPLSGGSETGKQVWVELGKLGKSDKGAEVIESPEVAAFRKEKNLAVRKEIIDGKEHYLYYVDIAKPYPRKNPDGTIHEIFGNEDVDRIIAKKVYKFLNSVLDDDAKKYIENLGARKDMSDLQKMSTAFEYLRNKFESKLVPDWEKKLDTFKPDFEALMKAYLMDFDHPPTLSELKGKYAEFLKALEKVSADFDQLVRPGWDKEAINSTVPLPESLKFLGPIYLEYGEALKTMDRYAKNPERYPEGLTFNLKLNNTLYPARVVYREGKCMLFYRGGALAYNRIEDAMADLNSGNLHRGLNQGVLMREDWYEPWEGVVGELNSAEWTPEDGPGVIQLDFDWKGQDAIVNAQVLPHGQIIYTIRRENVGLHGEEYRSGRADNFFDFMVQLGQIKKWAEGPEHGFEENVGVRKQALFTEITDPFSYRNRQPEIGRVVASRLIENGVQQTYLDWGGGNNPYDKRNVMLNVWATKNGELKFILSGRGIGSDGRVDTDSRGVGPEKVSDFNALMARVRKIRENAGVILDNNGVGVKVVEVAAGAARGSVRGAAEKPERYQPGWI